MKRNVTIATFSVMCVCTWATVYAQSAAVQLTPMQQEMLKDPGSHLCGDAVTNAPCAEVERMQREESHGHAPTTRYDLITPGFNGDRLPPAPKLTREGSWTPAGGQYDELAKAHGWMELAENDQWRAWVAYRVSDGDPLKAKLALKTVSKQMDGSSGEVDILSGDISCQPNGAPPNMITIASYQKYAWSHAELYADVWPYYRLEPGTLPAIAAQEICKQLSLRK